MKNHVLYTVIGILVGFIAGYMMHEVMADRQPARLVAGSQVPAQAAPGNPAAGSPATGGAGPGAMQAMQQVQELRAHVEANPDDKDAIRLLANMNYDIQNWSRAVELYERYLVLAPDSVDVMTDLGVSYRSMGNVNKALELFARARALAPDNWQARYNEVIVLAFDRGELSKAQEAIAELEALAPGNPEVERLAAEIERRLAGT